VEATNPGAVGYVAIWLRGKSFGLGHPLANKPAATELLGYLRIHGYDVVERKL
jgi:hypothetical protein